METNKNNAVGMKVSGFSFVRNALKFDYPIKEAITSILPLCDEFVLAVGNSEDETIELIESIPSDKIKIIHTTWDETLREGGRVLAEETNKAFDAIAHNSDWAFYIQGDEVVHEKYLPVIETAMREWKAYPEVEGLLFKYLHFYGSYDYVANSKNWYRNEIRIIRNDKTIRSYKDAQGFRKSGQKLKVKPIDAYIYHYGWVKPPSKQQAKQEQFNKLWHDDKWVEKNIPDVEEFDYSKIDSLDKFKDSHPEVMHRRIAEKNWDFTFDTSKNRPDIKNRIARWVEQKTNWRIGEYKNYKII